MPAMARVEQYSEGSAMRSSSCSHLMPHFGIINLLFVDQVVSLIPRATALLFVVTTSMLQHSMFFAMRIGEASNPGPSQQSTRVVICNPAAILRKVCDLMRCDGNIYLVSETSATSATQTVVKHEMSKFKFSCFWSPPVPSKTVTDDFRPSFRGEAVGTLIACNIPARTARVDIPPALQNSLRFCCNITRIGNLEVFVVALYGFQRKTVQGQKLNDLLLTHIFQLISQVGLPFLIGGDFNEPPMKLPIFDCYRDMGAVEAFHLYQCRFGNELPPTCNDCTRNDTLILHPALAQRVVNMSVDKDLQMDVHVPLCIDFDISTVIPPGLQWKAPKSWAPLQPDTEIMEKFYLECRSSYQNKFDNISNIDEVDTALHAWSQAVEFSVDKTIQHAHRTDPLRNPLPCLPSSFKGRCSKKCLQQSVNPSTLKGDKHGGYEPTSEIFSLKNKHKARQVRRLRSLLRALKSAASKTTQTDHCHQQQLQNEWSKICTAKGYEHKWSNWILGFEVIPYVPLFVPDYATLELMCQITAQDCEASCHQESLQRKKFFHHKVQVDCDDNYSKMCYKSIKQKPQATLDEVPVTYTTKGFLHRCSKNDNTIRLEECIPLVPHCKIAFGEAEVQVLSYQHPLVSFRGLKGVVPASGTVTFKQIGILSGEIFQAFRSFWSPMWLRDTIDDQFNDANWESFKQELERIPLPNIPIDFSLNNPVLWKEVISSLKNNKAHGCCAWRHEELKLLPFEAIKDLAHIFSQVTLIGMSPASMTARTILLSKVPLPQSMNHGRPITILGVLYRLVGKVIFKQVAQAWCQALPFSISGGLPQRGVKDVAVAQKFCIEPALKSKSQLGGFSLDLIKAFNTFPRRPLAMVMKKMGLPEWIISFWLNSLASMTRYLDHAGTIHGPIASTTGVPEGNALSVLSMISLSACFYYRLADVHTWPYAYADNWSWLTCSQKSHFRAYIKMLNLTSSLKLQIDFGKSWHWSISKNFRQFCESFTCLFPNDNHHVVVKRAVKDLGEMVHYQKSMGLGFIKEKIQEAISRAHRLEFLPLSVQTKAKIIQSAIWTVGLYSADTIYLGGKHFQDLRRAATQAIMGKSKQASSWLTCFSLSSFLIDPFLHVILGILRTIRRLYQLQPELA